MTRRDLLEIHYLQIAQRIYETDQAKHFRRDANCAFAAETGISKRTLSRLSSELPAAAPELQRPHAKLRHPSHVNRRYKDT